MQNTSAWPLGLGDVLLTAATATWRWGKQLLSSSNWSRPRTDGGFAMQGRYEGSTVAQLLLLVILPFLLGLLVLYATMKLGKQFVCKPQLRPDLAEPWK